MTLWQEITASALVGSERNAWVAPAGDDPLRRLLSAIPGEGAALLAKSAAVVSVSDRAGRVPVTRERELPQPCPVDVRPRCGPRAAFHLRSMLTGSFAALLPEWLATVIAVGQRVPEELVPALLRSASRGHSELVNGAVGPLASWLEMPLPRGPGRVNPLLVDWNTGTSDERLTLLEHLRNHEPASAIEHIRETWNVDKADQRADFLRMLKPGLSAADEAFLETVVDDKSIVVRRVAADLLSRIPDSALARRIVTAIGASLQVASKGLLVNRKKTIAVTLLTELPAALVRDGVEPRGAPQGMGERSWWTSQAIALVPPSLWTNSLEMTPDQLLDAAKEGEDGTLLTAAWTGATIRHRSADWARAILLSGGFPESRAGDLFELLSHSDREIIVFAGDQERMVRYAGLCRHPWSLSFTRTLMKQPAEWPLPTLREFGRFACIDYLDEIPAEAAPGMLEFASVLRFRREMHLAIEDRQ